LFYFFAGCVQNLQITDAHGCHRNLDLESQDLQDFEISATDLPDQRYRCVRSSDRSAPGRGSSDPRVPNADLKIGARKGRDLKNLNNVKSPWLAILLRAIFRAQRPRAGIFRSPYADLKIGARKGRDLKISTSRVSNNLRNAK